VQGADQGRSPATGRPVVVVLDVALALAGAPARLARAGAGWPVHVAAEAARRLGRGLPGPSAEPLVRELAARGAQSRARWERRVAEGLRTLFRRAVDAALATIDLTEVVLTHLDLDTVAAGIDVDAVAARADLDAVLARLDLDAVLARLDLDAVLARLDLDAVLARLDVAAVVGRLDLDAIVAGVDLDRITARVDLDRIAADLDLDSIAKTIDVDAIVARVDLDRIASRIDVAPIVARVDPDAVVARVDVDALLDRLDLVGIARGVIAALDLPEILRESTGAASSQAARAVRTEGMHADESVSRFIDRVLHRAHAPGPAGS
jgi:hypothetical protein